MTGWLVVLAATAGSYAVRASMLVALADRPLPPAVARRLALVAPAAIGALLAATLIGSDGSTLPLVAACVAAFLATRCTGNVDASLLVGFPVLWLLQAVVG